MLRVRRISKVLDPEKKLLLALLLAQVPFTLLATRATWALFNSSWDSTFEISVGEWGEPPGHAGTSIEAHKTAVGFLETRTAYVWSLSKTAELAAPVDEDTFEIGYVIIAERNGEETLVAGVRGDVCVTNTGEMPTEGLAILEVVQAKSKKGKFEDWKYVELDLGEDPVLGGGKSHCYTYEIGFEPDEGVQYRNVARVTITNHSGWLPGGKHCPGEEPCPFGPEPKAEFSFPAVPEIVEIDGRIELVDVITCPLTFVCTCDAQLPFELNESSILKYSAAVEATEGLICGNVLNTASLYGEGGGVLGSATSWVNVCAPEEDVDEPREQAGEELGGDP